MIVGDDNIPLLIVDRTSRQQINKENGDLHNTTDEMKLSDIYKTFHTTIEEYILFSSTYEILFSMDHMFIK